MALLLAAPLAAQCPGTEDAFEDNDDCASAWALTAGSYPGLYVEKSATDPDYFKFTLAAGDYFDASVAFTHADGDIDIRLTEDTCTTTLDSSASTGDSEDVTYYNGSGATMDVVLNIYVYSGSTNDCNYYDLDVAINPDPCLTTPDDGLEDNDDCATAITGPLGLTTGLQVFKTDHDFYTYTLADGETIDVTAYFVDDDGDLDIILYDATACGGGVGTGLAEGTSVTDDEVLSYTNGTGAALAVVLQVYVYTNSTSNCNGYDLEVAIGGPSTIGTNYCGPANLNSSGLPGVMSAVGSDVVSANDVTLHATQLAVNQFGYFVNSQTQGFVANPGGSQGNLCLGGSTGRHVSTLGSTGAAGELSATLDLTQMPTPSGPYVVQPGETWNFQCWFRDMNPGSTSNFTDGLEILFQ